MLPDTWLPTCTVVTACSVPVAPTVSTMSPRVIGAVLTWISGAAAPDVVRAGAGADGGDDQQADECSLHECVAVLPSSAVALPGRRADHGDVQVLQRRLLQALELDERLAVVQNRLQLVVLRRRADRAAPARRSSWSTCRPRTCSVRPRAVFCASSRAACAACTRSTLLCTVIAALVTSVATCSSICFSCACDLVQLHARARDRSPPASSRRADS